MSKCDGYILIPPFEGFTYPWIIRIPLECRHNRIVEIAKIEKIMTRAPLAPGSLMTVQCMPSQTN